MDRVLVGHQDGLIYFLAVIFCIALANAVTMRFPARRRRSAALPRVSILVPARDEERGIEACIRSLLAQDYPDFELIVLDDGSTDRTREILERLVAAGPGPEGAHLRILQGEPAPPGWLGKHWACHQLALASGGEVLLFTDADTVHAPTCLAEAVSALRAGRIDLLSAVPGQEMRSAGEKLLVAPLLWAVMSFSPLALAYLLRIPALAVAVGQFMLFERSAYEKIGGHEAVRMNVLDDFALARRIVSAGLRWRLFDGRRLLCARMYDSFRQAWAGLAKNLCAVFGYNVVVNAFVWIWLLLVFAGPPVVLGARGAGFDTAPLRAAPAAAAAGLGLATWLVAYVRFGVPPYLALLYPLNVVLLALLGFHSLWANLTGTASWKGRTFRGRNSPVR